MTVCTADYWVDCLLFWLLLPVALVRLFFFFLSSPFWNRRPTPQRTNVLSSGLPLPAPGLPGSLFVSGVRGLGSGCPEERGPGAVVLRLSLQPLPGIGCFLRVGRRGLLQSAVILHGSDDGIPILHGKYIYYILLFNRACSSSTAGRACGGVWSQCTEWFLFSKRTARQAVRIYTVFVVTH